ncbi:MAG TPA: cytochrome P460 family protein, partial [Vicinamibacteria bacterium]|nr:cytochrome P460 family protein [Vicinamibacteria bacterium]
MSAAGSQEAVPSSDQPAYTREGELIFPAGYREWVFLGSGLGMTYGPAAPRPGENPAFDNVFVNPSAFARFKETGRWPDGTMFALEIRYSTSHGSINKGGHYQTDLAALEIHVKDSKRFKE